MGSAPRAADVQRLKLSALRHPAILLDGRSWSRKPAKEHPDGWGAQVQNPHTLAALHERQTFPR